MPLTTLCTMTHGSRLFGTATEDSDTDIKSVVIPDARDIALGRINTTQFESTGENKANTREDTDTEVHDLMRFCSLVTSGQAVALEMLFAPDDVHLHEPHPLWRELQANRERLISKRSQKMIDFFRSQALAYGINPGRVEAAKRASWELSEIITLGGKDCRIGQVMDQLVEVVDSEHVRIDERSSQGSGKQRFLVVCNKMVSEFQPLEEGLKLTRNVVRQYESRAASLDALGGKDWKALSHALRIGYQAVELFTTGKITFPRPEAEHLLRVKKGLLDISLVGSEIMALLDNVERSFSQTSLPEESDCEWAEDFIVETHTQIVSGGSCVIQPAKSY